MTSAEFSAPHPDRQEPRLSVGVISGGAVGTAVAETLLRAGHHIHGIVARSSHSLDRVRDRLPGVPVTTVADAAQAALVIIAVPDPELAGVVEQVAEVTRAGQIVMHTSGASGCEALQPVTDTGALPLALHPVMTFTGRQDDVERLDGCPWGVTSDSSTGAAVAELLVGACGGVPVHVAEERRPMYHAAIAHGANHLVTLVSESLRMLDHALQGTESAGGTTGPSTASPNPQSAVLLRRILPAVLEEALEHRQAALTGPVARDDAAAVLRHLAALRVIDAAGDGGESPLSEVYREAAARTARLVGSLDVERALDGDYPDPASDGPAD